MAIRIEAIINPALLVWARKTAGLTESETASKIKADIKRIQSWEVGETRPSVSQLRRLAEIYKRPLAVFFLAEPPKGFEAMHDFRRLPEEFLGRESPDLRLEIRKAHYRREAAIDLYDLLQETPPRFEKKFDLHADAEEVAGTIRSLLGIEVKSQSGWKSEYEAFNTWRHAVETLGILVFQSSGIDLEEMRGFSLALDPLPIIALNVKDSVRGRMFTLFHELAHVMLREDGICDLDEGTRHKSRDQQVEIQANMIAGAALVPRATLLGDSIVVSATKERAWPEEEIAVLAKRFWVSREVILRRLLIIGKTTNEFYRQKHDQYAQEYKSFAKAGGFVQPHVSALSKAGELYVRLVLSGYAQEKITSSDLSDLLEVRLKHIPKIQEALLRRSYDSGAET